MKRLNYFIKKSKLNNQSLLENWKLQTVLQYSNDLASEEVTRIKNYVHKSIKDNVNLYNIIELDEHDIGCFLVVPYKDAYLLDEIYLEKEYRNQGIGTEIISNILKKYGIVYLWVYKDNKSAIRLYEKLGFNILEETETRYLMKFEKNN